MPKEGRLLLNEIIPGGFGMSKKKYEKPVVNVTKYDISDRVCACEITSAYVTCEISGTTELATNCSIVTYETKTYFVWHSEGGGSSRGTNATSYENILSALISNSLISCTNYGETSTTKEHWHICDYDSTKIPSTIINS